jgi:hypothetical protein
MHAVSIRFRNRDTYDRLRRAAQAAEQSISAYSEQLIDEALRCRAHPLITFRDGPTGRRAALSSGPDVWEVVGAIVGGNVPADQRVARASELLGLPVSHVEAALDYYAEFTEEIDARIAANDEITERELGLWEKRQGLLAS